MKMVNNQLKEIGYDSKKMPLGKLAISTIKKGYSVLNELMNVIKAKKPPQNKIESLSSDFFSLIPHDFGFQKMKNFILNNEEKVKAKLDMLQSLTDMQITSKLIEVFNFFFYLKKFYSFILFFIIKLNQLKENQN